MLDTAAIVMSHGKKLAYGYAEGVNDNMCQSHFHEFFELYYLESGERHHMIEGNLYHLTANEVVLFPPNVMHHSYGDKNMPFKRIVLYFTPDMIAYPEVRTYLQKKPRIFSLKKTKKTLLHFLLSMLDSEWDKEDGIFQQEYLESLLNQLLLTILRADYTPVQSTPKTRSAQAVNYIHEHYAEEISIPDLAEMLYVSPYHLCREFKKATGKTIVQYLNMTRVLHAQRMLLETDYNITRISKETGFSNLTHFNRIFKSIAGMSPSEKRKQYKTI